MGPMQGVTPTEICFHWHQNLVWMKLSDNLQNSMSLKIWWGLGTNWCGVDEIMNKINLI